MQRRMGLDRTSRRSSPACAAGALALLATGLSGCATVPTDQALAPGPRDLRRGEAVLRRAERAQGVERVALTDRAVRSLQRAVAADPLLFQAHLGLGRCYYVLGEYSLEVAEYRKCVAVNPSCAEGWASLGNTLHCRMELVEARAAYQRALLIYGPRVTDRAGVLYDLALVERDLGHLEGAEACLHQALPLADESLEPRVRQRLAEVELERSGPRLLGPR